jgi:hypothetical protein
MAYGVLHQIVKPLAGPRRPSVRAQSSHQLSGRIEKPETLASQSQKRNSVSPARVGIKDKTPIFFQPFNPIAFGKKNTVRGSVKSPKKLNVKMTIIKINP